MDIFGLPIRWSCLLVIPLFGFIGWLVWAYVRCNRIDKQQLRIAPTSEEGETMIMPPQPFGELHWYRCPHCDAPQWTDIPICPTCAVSMSLSTTPEEDFACEMAQLECALSDIAGEAIHLTVHEANRLFTLEDQDDFENYELLPLLLLARRYSSEAGMVL